MRGDDHFLMPLFQKYPLGFRTWGLGGEGGWEVQGPKSKTDIWSPKWTEGGGSPIQD